MSVLRTISTLVSPGGSSSYHCLMFIVFAFYYVLVRTLQFNILQVWASVTSVATTAEKYESKEINFGSGVEPVPTRGLRCYAALIGNKLLTFRESPMVPKRR